MSFVSLLKENSLQIAEMVTLLLQQEKDNKYATLDREDLLSRNQRIVEAFIRCLESGEDQDFTDYIRKIGHERALEGFRLADVVTALSRTRDAFISYLEKTSNDPELLFKRTKIIINIIDQARLKIGEAYLQTREEIISQQKVALIELSTPVIPLFEGILIIPLIGTIDTGRAQDVLENLLQGIIREQAQIAIIDVTGVPVIDTAVADHLIKAVQAANLLGCTCILVGIGPEVAQAIVSLGVYFTNIITKRSLRQGLEYALQLLGLEISSINSLTGRSNL